MGFYGRVQTIFIACKNLRFFLARISTPFEQQCFSLYLKEKDGEQKRKDSTTDSSYETFFGSRKFLQEVYTQIMQNVIIMYIVKKYFLSHLEIVKDVTKETLR